MRGSYFPRPHACPFFPLLSLISCFAVGSVPIKHLLGDGNKQFLARALSFIGRFIGLILLPVFLGVIRLSASSPIPCVGET